MRVDGKCLIESILRIELVDVTKACVDCASNVVPAVVGACTECEVQADGEVWDVFFCCYLIGVLLVLVVDMADGKPEIGRWDVTQDLETQFIWQSLHC